MRLLFVKFITDKDYIWHIDSNLLDLHIVN